MTFKNSENFFPDSDHELFKKPPALGSRLPKLRADHFEGKCLTAKQWAKLIDWCVVHFETLREMDENGRLQVALFGSKKLSVYSAGSTRLVDDATMQEAWSQAIKRKGGAA